MHYYVFFVLVLVSGCVSSIDRDDKFTPHSLNGNMRQVTNVKIDGNIYQVTNIKRLTSQAMRKLNKYSHEKGKKGLTFSVGPLVNNQFESSQYRSETPKNLRRTFEAILTELIDGTSHFQSDSGGACIKNQAQKKLVDKLEVESTKLAAKFDTSSINIPYTTWVDMVISGEYSWYEKNIEGSHKTISPILVGGSTDIDTTLGNYKSTSQGQVIVTVQNCQSGKQFSVKEKVDVFEVSNDNSIYLFSEQFGIVWISKEKQRGSVNVAMEEALQVAMLKAMLLAAGDTFNDIEKFITLPKIIRNSMDKRDQSFLSETLELNKTNTTKTHFNHNSGNRYTITPIRTYYITNYNTNEQEPCREFLIEATIKGKVETGRISACRQ